MNLRNPTDHRFARLAALGLAGLAIAVAVAAPAGAQDLTGTVQAVDTDAKTIRVRRDDGRVVTVRVPNQTRIEVQGRQPINLEKLLVGTRVTVADDVTAAEIRVDGETLGTVRTVDRRDNRLVVDAAGTEGVVTFALTPDTVIEDTERGEIPLGAIRPGQPVMVVHDRGVPSRITVEPPPPGMVGKFWSNVHHNLFKPLLLFFYVGFLIPILGVKFEFPYVMYQGLTIYLLVAIGWHGGEELALLDRSSVGQAAGFMAVGFLTNLVIGVLAYLMLRGLTRLRHVDAATVAGYYGSDSAGTFVTCMGVLGSLHMAYAPYMPVMLAVMEIPGCLVALALVARLRGKGMDASGNLPGERDRPSATFDEADQERALEAEAEMALERPARDERGHSEAHGHGEPRKPGERPPGLFNPELLHEVFLNPGIFLLFAGILIGFLSRLQGTDVTSPDDRVFLDLFPGLLCLFLLEMGMTASRKLRDLRSAGWPFILFGLLAPNLFAGIGIAVAHAYSMALGQPFALGTYALFAVLCGAASYIAVPAVQRLAIPEASPTLPLAAALGLTFSYNVTIGIPVYIEVAEQVTRWFPVG